MPTHEADYPERVRLARRLERGAEHATKRGAESMGFGRRAFRAQNRPVTERNVILSFVSRRRALNTLTTFHKISYASSL